MSLVAPDYVTPSRRRHHRAPIVSLKPVGAPVSQGIKLWVNSDKFGFQLADGAEGFGMADVENTLAALSQGGASLRHQRSLEGEMYLPIQLTAPSSAALEEMTAKLADIVNPASGMFEVVYYSPISQEARLRRAAYKNGMLTPAFWDPAGGFAEYGITADFEDPLWRGVERPIEFEIAPQRKPLITAYQGELDPDSPPLVTYEWEGEPHASPSVKRVGGEVVARNLIDNPSFEKSAVRPYSDSHAIERTGERSRFGDYSVRAYAVERYNRLGVRFINVSATTGTYAASAYFYIPSSNSSDSTRVRFQFGTYATEFYDEVLLDQWFKAVVTFELSDEYTHTFYIGVENSGAEPGDEVFVDGVHVATAATESEALAQVEEYFDGDTLDELGRYEGYQFPFLPMMVHSSTVQGEQSIRVEGDAPAWPTYTITGPGEDLRIINQNGAQLHIPGEIDEEITITTEPGKQTIRDSNGDSLMNRLEFGTDVFFPLPPGEQTIMATMVNASRESMVRIVYEEQFRLPAGNVRRR